MAGHSIPHFHNDLGLKAIRVGSKEFMCQGATAPFDHPHIFIDLGSDDEAVCSYCSTLYKYDSSLHEGTSDPASCTVISDAA